MVWVLPVLLVLLGSFVLWRLTSVGRGARQRDLKLLRVLDPLAQRLSKAEPVDADEIASLAKQAQLRPMLYAMLTEYRRLELFPAEHLSHEAQGSARLAYWMMHPNELETFPEQLELVEGVSRELKNGVAEFFVYRFQMAPGHWAAEKGWILGLAGPYTDNDAPYVNGAGAFSRGDKEQETTAAQLVDWYIDIARQKGAPW